MICETCTIFPVPPTYTHTPMHDLRQHLPLLCSLSLLTPYPTKSTLEKDKKSGEEPCRLHELEEQESAELKNRVVIDRIAALQDDASPVWHKFSYCTFTSKSKICRLEKSNDASVSESTDFPVTSGSSSFATPPMCTWWHRTLEPTAKCK